MSMVNTPEPLQETASQTAGPYVHIGLAPHAAGFDIFEKNFSNVLAGSGTRGDRIRIEGRVIDGNGNVMPDAMVEIWQADSQGRYVHPVDGRPVASDPSGSDTASAGTTNIGGRQIALPPPNRFVQSRPRPTA